MYSQLWRLRWDVATTRAILFVCDPLHLKPVNPDLRLYLVDRYRRLAVGFARQGKPRKARRCHEKALHHFQLWGGPDPPPAVAIALPIPRPPIFVDAVGQAVKRGGKEAA